MERISDLQLVGHAASLLDAAPFARGISISDFVELMLQATPKPRRISDALQALENADLVTVDGRWLRPNRPDVGPGRLFVEYEENEYLPATPQDLAHARERFYRGACPHHVFYDEPGWLYDTRVCYTCGVGLEML